MRILAKRWPIPSTLIVVALAAFGFDGGDALGLGSGSNPALTEGYWSAKTGLVVQIGVSHWDGLWIAESLSFGNHPSSLGYPSDNLQTLTLPPPFGSFPVWNGGLSLYERSPIRFCSFRAGSRGYLEDLLNLDITTYDEQLEQILGKITSLAERPRWVGQEGWRQVQTARGLDDVRGGYLGIEGLIHVTVWRVPAAITWREWYEGRVVLAQFAYLIEDQVGEASAVRDLLELVIEEDLSWIHDLAGLFLTEDRQIPIWSSTLDSNECLTPDEWKAYFPDSSPLIGRVLGRRRWIEGIN
ncbi:hypothetical protein H8D30_05885 [bacterium]|nr:hypothetical protein [bacterium]